MDIQKLCNLIEERKEDLFTYLSNLVQINSENWGPYGNEKECAEYIAKLCDKMGLETDLYSPLDLEGFREHPDHLDGRHLEDRLNVTVRFKGETDEDYLMLMGHSDTVVIGDRALWSFEPLSGEIRDGKIWGRGACDDKYALATVLFLIQLLKEQGLIPKKNLLFTAYCDEERGGSNGALAAVLRYPAEKIVNMDCKKFEIWHCASGGMEAKYMFHTEKTTDSAGITAKAFPIIMEVMEQFAVNRYTELDHNRFYKGTIIPGTSLRYMHFKAGDQGADLGNGEVQFVTYTDKTKEEIFAELQQLDLILKQRLAQIGIVGDGFVPATRFFHYGFSEPDCESIQDMQEAAKAVSGRALVPCGSCLSDLSVILKYGSKQAYGFGIGRDFDEYGGAHQPDEYVDCEELVEYAKIMMAYVIKTVF